MDPRGQQQEDAEQEAQHEPERRRRRTQGGDEWSLETWKTTSHMLIPFDTCFGLLYLELKCYVGIKPFQGTEN